MTMTDPVADMLTRIRNASRAKHATVDVPASKMKLAIAEILFNEGYIRKYDVQLFYDAKRSAAVFLVSVVIIAAMSIGLYYINLYRGGLVYYAGVPLDLNFIFTLTGSLGLFSFFRYFRMKENWFADAVRFAAPFTFGVYLLHMHIEIQDRWLWWLEHIFGEVPKTNVILFACHQLICILIVFAAGVFVDWIRKMIFDFLGRVLHETWIFKRIRQWDEDLC